MKLYRYIYRTVNLITRESYIGQHSTNTEYDKYIGSGKYFLNSVKKYGKNNFLRGIIEYCYSQDELNEREIYWISKFNTIIPNGYNLSIGGGVVMLFGKENGFYGKSHSEETRKYLSEIRMGTNPWNKGLKGVQKCSEEKKLSTSNRHKGEGNFHYNKRGELSPNFGIKRSDETKQRMKESKIGSNNPNMGVYEIYPPDGKYFYVDYGLIFFLNDHSEYKINRHFIYNASKKDTYKGWIVNKIN